MCDCIFIPVSKVLRTERKGEGKKESKKGRVKKRDTNEERGVSRDESSSRGKHIRQEAQES